MSPPFLVWIIIRLSDKGRSPIKRRTALIEGPILAHEHEFRRRAIMPVDRQPGVVYAS